MLDERLRRRHVNDAKADPRDYNSYEGCARCGNCCNIRVLAVTPDEIARITAYLSENSITPRDNGFEACPLLAADMSCMVWPVRPQTCRLHNCHKTRLEILAEHPEITREDNRPWIDTRRAFLYGDFSDPRNTIL